MWFVWMWVRSGQWEAHHRFVQGWPVCERFFCVCLDGCGYRSSMCLQYFALVLLFPVTTSNEISSHAYTKAMSSSMMYFAARHPLFFEAWEAYDSSNPASLDASSICSKCSTNVSSKKSRLPHRCPWNFASRRDERRRGATRMPFTLVSFCLPFALGARRHPCVTATSG